MRTSILQRIAMPRNAFRAAAALVLAALAACENTSEPSGVEGSYSVYSVNGQRPPADVRADLGGARLQVVDAELSLDAPNQASVELGTRATGGSGGTSAVTPTTYTGTYQVAGDVITFGMLESGGTRVYAEGVVISPREVAVTLHFAAPAYTGFNTYPVALILRR